MADFFKLAGRSNRGVEIDQCSRPDYSVAFRASIRSFSGQAISLALSFILLAASAAVAQEPPSQKILVHYMPWFVAKSEGQGWGYHWTMNHTDPNKVGEKGRREIASHNYPLIGAYDSADPHVLEYHVLLMKLSGIDGVIFDWYGSREYRDYPMINRNTNAMIPWIKKAGLQYTFCYEDQTVKHMVADKTINASEDVAEFVGELNKLADSHFSDSAWIKSNNKPLLLTFGPQHFKAEPWQEAMRQCKLAPAVFGLPYVKKSYGLTGSFAWPPVHSGGIVTTEKWKKFLGKVYDGKKSNELIPIVFPGFRDFYSQAKVQQSYGIIEEREGKTFAESLEFARQTGAELIQIATWNDFGEGTDIEPTREHGLRYLELLIASDKAPVFKKADLCLPLQLYRLRKTNAEHCEEVSAALFAGNCDRARQLLAQPR